MAQMDITNLNLVISILRTPFGTLDLGKGGNAKKYKREKNIHYSREQFSANHILIFMGGASWLFGFKCFIAVGADYIDFPRCPDDGAAAGACIFDTAVLRFLTAALACPGGL